MAEEEAPNRATIAIVNAKVGTVEAKVEGLGELIKSEFLATREAMEPLRGLPVEMAKLSGRTDALERRVENVENGSARKLNWRVMAVISLVSALIGGAAGHIPHFP